MDGNVMVSAIIACASLAEESESESEDRRSAPFSNLLVW